MRAKSRIILSLAAGVLFAATCASAAEKEAKFTSGLLPGDKLASFKCHSVAGPNKGKPLCYV